MYTPQKDSSTIHEIDSELADNLVFFLDYDGTLVGIVPNPEDAKADTDLVDLLSDLSKKFETYIVTGRSLDEMFGFLGRNLNFIALHGALSYRNGDVTPIVDNFQHYEKLCDQIYEKNLSLREKFPGLRMYNKRGNVLFHLGLMRGDQKPELLDIVSKLADENSMDIYHGKNIVELRIPGINKGIAINRFAKGRPSIILGDDATDEDAFLANPEAITVHIGSGPTAARYVLGTTTEARNLIRSVISSRQ